MSGIITTPLKTHGGKHYLARLIVPLLPEHIHYVEPYAGGLSVLLRKDPTGSELVNDIDHRIFNFWKVVSDVETFDAFHREVIFFGLSRELWLEAHEHQYGTDPIADAVAFFIDCRQSRAGQQKSFTAITRTRLRRGMNGNVSEYLSAIDFLPEVHARIRRVVIECRPALEVIRREDTPDTTFYCDPPYLPETRTSPRVYRHEMDQADHALLLGTLHGIKGKFLLSGYANPMYDDAALRYGWRRHDFQMPNHAAGGKTKRLMTESVWTNY
jgi:DNA adenine methylase